MTIKEILFMVFFWVCLAGFAYLTFVAASGLRMPGIEHRRYGAPYTAPLGRGWRYIRPRGYGEKRIKVNKSHDTETFKALSVSGTLEITGFKEAE